MLDNNKLDLNDKIIHFLLDLSAANVLHFFTPQMHNNPTIPHFTTLNNLQPKTRHNILCFIIHSFDWFPTRNNTFVLHLHVLDNTTQTRSSIAIFSDIKQNYEFLPGDIILLKDAYIDQNKKILKGKKHDVIKLSSVFEFEYSCENVYRIKKYFHESINEIYKLGDRKDWENNTIINYKGKLLNKTKELPNLVLLYFDNDRIFTVKAWGKFAKEAYLFRIGEMYLLESVKIMKVGGEYVGSYNESSKGYMRMLFDYGSYDYSVNKYEERTVKKNVDRNDEIKICTTNSSDSYSAIKNEGIYNESSSLDNTSVTRLDNLVELKDCKPGVYSVKFTILNYIGFPPESFYIKRFCQCKGIQTCLKCEKHEIDHFKLLCTDKTKIILILNVKIFENYEEYSQAIVTKDIVGNDVLYTVIEFIK